MALYGYSFKLPKDLSSEQKSTLEAIAGKTAKKASVSNTGKFRKGWRVRITGNTLIVYSKVAYAVFLEKGLGYNRHNRYKVRDALNKIGFEEYFEGEVGSLTVPAAVAGAALVTASGLEQPQEAPSSLNTAQVEEPNTLITSDDLIGLNPAEMRRLIQGRIQDMIPSRNRIPNSSFFNTTSLLALIAAAVAANEIIDNEEVDDGTTETDN